MVNVLADVFLELVGSIEPGRLIKLEDVEVEIAKFRSKVDTVEAVIKKMQDKEDLFVLLVEIL